MQLLLLLLLDLLEALCGLPARLWRGARAAMGRRARPLAHAGSPGAAAAAAPATAVAEQGAPAHRLTTLAVVVAEAEASAIPFEQVVDVLAW